MALVRKPGTALGLGRQDCGVPFERLIINGVPAEELVEEKKTEEKTAITSYTGRGFHWETVPSRGGWHVRVEKTYGESPLEVGLEFMTLPEREGKKIRTSTTAPATTTTPSSSNDKCTFTLSKGNFRLKVKSGEIARVTAPYDAEPFTIKAKDQNSIEIYAGYGGARDSEKSFGKAKAEETLLQKRRSNELLKDMHSLSLFLDKKYVDVLLSDLNVLSSQQHRGGAISASTAFCNDDYVKSWGRDAYFVWKARKSVSDSCKAEGGGSVVPEWLDEEQRGYERFITKTQIKGPFQKHNGFWHQKYGLDGRPAEFIWEDWKDDGRGWQPDDQLGYPASVLFSARGGGPRQYLARRRALKAVRKTVPELDDEGGAFPHPFECDNSWEDRFQTDSYPKPYSAVISLLEAGEALKKSKNGREKITGERLGRTAYRELVNNFYAKSGDFEGFCRNALDKRNPYDSAVLYADPILEYLCGIKEKDPAEFRDGLSRVGKTLENQLRYDRPIAKSGDAGLTRIVSGRKMVARYNGDGWDGKRGWTAPPAQNVWPLASLTASYSLLKLSRIMYDNGIKGSGRYHSLGKELLDSTMDITYIPEQLESVMKEARRLSSTPLAWAHAMRVLSINELGAAGRSRR